jgi:hypothetical protein
LGAHQLLILVVPESGNYRWCATAEPVKVSTSLAGTGVIAAQYPISEHGEENDAGATRSREDLE